MNKVKAILLAFLIGFSLLGVAQTNNGGFGQSDIKIDIYPNPATDHLTVDLSQINTQEVTFELRSMIGNSIRINPEKVSYREYRISLKDYATGYYFLIIQDEHARFKKAIKFLKH
jgi:hypothetical protein